MLVFKAYLGRGRSMDPKVAKENQDKNQKNKMKALEYLCFVI